MVIIGQDEELNKFLTQTVGHKHRVCHSIYNTLICVCFPLFLSFFARKYTYADLRSPTPFLLFFFIPLPFLFPLGTGGPI